jgi:Domain of unknown function (DUF4111)
MSVPLTSVPPVAADVWRRLRDDLQVLLEDDLVAIWGYGARSFPEAPRRLGDVDTLVVVSRTPTVSVAQSLHDADAANGQDHGIALDTTYVLTADLVQERPRDALSPGRRHDATWAFHRAHLLAGRYVALFGPEPVALVPPPSWPQLVEAMRSELDHIERHVVAGDDDPYEASYALLQGCRILYGVETGETVISKRAAASWGLDHLPERWRSALQAAQRAYDGAASEDDTAALREAMAPFVTLVRGRFDANLP